MSRRRIEDGELVALETLAGGVEINLPGRFVHLPPGSSAADFWNFAESLCCPHSALHLVTADEYPCVFV